MKLLAVLAIAMFLVAAGCLQQTVREESKNISERTDNLKNAINAGGLPTAAKGDIVHVDYVGKLESGKVFDTSIEAEAKKAGLPLRSSYEPLQFTVGAGQMISGFDAAVVGMAEGQTKTVTLKPFQAYGERNEEMVVSVPLSNIQGSGNVEVGTELVANGMRGVVTNVSGGNATVDFNHELAGKTLIFTIKMVKVTKKT